MNPGSHFIFQVCIFLLIFFSGSLQAEKKEKGLRYEDKDIKVRIFLRSPDQMQAFYEGREFPIAAIKEITKTCNITAVIKNKSKDILWLILNEWEFKSDNKTITRIDRTHWNKIFKAANLKQAHRSTFGWTLLPENRDLRPDEGVGGGVTIPGNIKTVDLVLNFPTGKNKTGPLKSITINNISCSKNTDKK